MQKPIRTIVSAAVMVAMANNVAHAGSFSLYTESSAAAIGNYAAGIAAEAADASTGWYNPAGLSLIHGQQAVSGLVGVFPSSKLSGVSTFSTQGFPGFVQTFHDQKGAKPGYVPSFHYALPVGENTTFGLSMLAPFGLATDWGRAGPLRYAATTSNLYTVNIAPEVGSQVTEHVAVGAGIDFQYAHVRFNTVLGSPAMLQAFGAPPMALDSLSYNLGHSFGFGFHAGIMGLFNADHTRIGLNYQSQVRHRFTGYSYLKGRLADLTPVVTSPLDIIAADPGARFYNNALSSNNITLPDVVTLSGYQDVNENLAVLGSVVYTGWKSLQSIELQRVAAYAPVAGQVLVNSTTTENYRNTWRFAVGANYHVNQQWMLRAGTGYDQTPTQYPERDIRVPDSNRWAASVGAHYQARPSLGVDLGYTRLFSIGNSRINKTIIAGNTSTYNVSARNKSYADLVGVQAVWTLDEPVPVDTK